MKIIPMWSISRNQHTSPSMKSVDCSCLSQPRGAQLLLLKLKMLPLLTKNRCKQCNCIFEMFDFKLAVSFITLTQSKFSLHFQSSSRVKRMRYGDRVQEFQTCLSPSQLCSSGHIFQGLLAAVHSSSG